MYPSLQSTERIEKIVGDDWIFTFTVTDNSSIPPGPANLSGYTPGGTLVIPRDCPRQINGEYVDISRLSSGMFSLSIPASITDNYCPNNVGYSLQVYLIDPLNRKQTYLVVPLQIVSVHPK